uniref:Charged multivesicular body protein 7 n=1 Tax=Anopheles farauti TaxID=69004 RepID=A0A182QIJ9_9DIPT
MEHSTSLPDNTFFPECWSDDRRMGVLLAEFRPRQLNTVSYDTKMEFWKNLILSYCRTTGSCVVSISMLKERFRRKGTVPYCLHTVFGDMLSKGELCNEQQLNTNKSTSGPLGLNLWAVGKMFKAPLQWGYGVVRDTVLGQSNVNENDHFIALQIAQVHAQLIEEIVAERKLNGKVIKYDDFITLISETSLITRQGLHPVVALLQQNNRLTRDAVTIDGAKIDLIKFADRNASTAEHITHIEKSVYELEETETQLMKDINLIEHKITQTMDQVREYIKDGRKQMAKTHLKKKNMLEKNMQNKISALETLQIIISKIHNCQTDKNVIEAYKLGTKSLKKVFEDAGITLDQVDETLAEMKEVLEQNDEMAAMIGTVSNNGDMDELELEQELSDLLDMKLAENNIESNNITHPPTVSVNNTNDFDKEIEKRLAALRVGKTDVTKILDVGM